MLPTRLRGLILFANTHSAAVTVLALHRECHIGCVEPTIAVEIRLSHVTEPMTAKVFQADSCQWRARVKISATTRLTGLEELQRDEAEIQPATTRPRGAGGR